MCWIPGQRRPSPNPEGRVAIGAAIAPPRATVPGGLYVSAQAGSFALGHAGTMRQAPGCVWNRPGYRGFALAARPAGDRTSSRWCSREGLPASVGGRGRVRLRGWSASPRRCGEHVEREPLRSVEAWLVGVGRGHGERVLPLRDGGRGSVQLPGRWVDRDPRRRAGDRLLRSREPGRGDDATEVAR